MRSLATVCLVIVATAALSQGVAGEAETIEAINASSNALDKAFEQNDKAAIKALMTPDHISVTPHYDGQQTTDDQIASLPELKWEQKIEHDMVVVSGVERHPIGRAGLGDTTHHVKRPVTVERGDLDRHHVLDRRKPAPE